jgi:partner of Y14 and mago protein
MYFIQRPQTDKNQARLYPSGGCSSVPRYEAKQHSKTTLTSCFDASGTKQAQQDANALPKGHIIGWAPPPTSQASGSATKPMSKSAKKNAKRREKKEEKKDETVAENWEDDDEAPTASRDSGAAEQKKAPRSSSGSAHTPEHPNWAAAPDEAALTAKLEKLDVK